jgi:hypothetical protein
MEQLRGWQLQEEVLNVVVVVVVVVVFKRFDFTR